MYGQSFIFPREKHEVEVCQQPPTRVSSAVFGPSPHTYLQQRVSTCLREPERTKNQIQREDTQNASATRSNRSKEEREERGSVGTSIRFTLLLGVASQPGGGAAGFFC